MGSISFVVAFLSFTQGSGQATQAETARRIAGTLALAAQEYRLAWQGGELARPQEALEARLFLAEARRSARELPRRAGAEVEAKIAALEGLLMAAAPAESVAERAAAIERHLAVGLGVSLDDRPARAPSLKAGARLYAARCAQCHGEAGRGDGPAGRGLTPPPAKLSDASALASRTPLDLYRTLTFGIPGTGMPAFGAILTREDRWDVVAHVLALSDSAAGRGRSGAMAIIFATVRGSLGGALDLARRGESEAAGRRAFDAYLAFEAVEGTLRATDPALVSRAEARFASFREAALSGAPVATLESRNADLLTVLAQAEMALSRGRSKAGLLLESFLLIVREGFEAILVIAAIMAVLIKSGAEERRRSVRWGIALAVAASLVTAALLEWLFRVTPAQREALEGGVMLAAAGMLFYVSYWLISKIQVAAWQRFLSGHVQRAARNGSGLALTAVAFLAVYREGFETVLFYKALYVTGGVGGAAPISLGIVSGAAVLVGLFLGIERFGLKIPLRPFFAVTSAMLYYMAFVFAGKGIKELQEGAIVSTTVVPGGPRNDFLGIYPTVETLAVQIVIALCLAVALAWTFGVRPRRARAERLRRSTPAAQDADSRVEETATV